MLDKFYLILLDIGEENVFNVRRNVKIHAVQFKLNSDVLNAKFRITDNVFE